MPTQTAVPKKPCVERKKEKCEGKGTRTACSGVKGPQRPNKTQERITIEDLEKLITPPPTKEYRGEKTEKEQSSPTAQQTKLRLKSQTLFTCKKTTLKVDRKTSEMKMTSKIVSRKQ